jgi:hypothetical protein
VVFLKLILFAPCLSVLIHDFVVSHLLHLINFIKLVNQASLFIVSALFSFPLGISLPLLFNLEGVWHIPKLAILDPLGHSED